MSIPEPNEKEEAIRIIRKEIKSLQSKIGVFPKDFIDAFNNIIRELKK